MHCVILSNLKYSEGLLDVLDFYRYAFMVILKIVINKSVLCYKKRWCETSDQSNIRKLKLL